MSVIDPSDLTFNGEEVKALSEAIITDFYKNPSLNEFHTLVSGIKAKKQIAILGLLGKVGKKQTNCTISENASQIPASEKFWNPVMIGDRFVQCWTDLLETFWIYGTKNGVNKDDLTSTDFANFLNEKLGEALQDAAFRLAWFGDTAAANYNDSPAGVITNSVDPSWYTPLDGFWKQIFAVVTADADRKTAIANNAQATYALQKFSDTDTTNQVVTGIFQTMIDSADERLIESGNAIMIATRSMVLQYKRERRKFSNIDQAYTRTETGWDTIEIDGIPVYTFSFWDRTIKADFDNGTKWYLPHRAVLTTKENLQVGTEEVGNLSELKPFYDNKTKTYNVDFGFNLDAKLIEDYKIQVAY